MREQCVYITDQQPTDGNINDNQIIEDESKVIEQESKLLPSKKFKQAEIFYNAYHKCQYKIQDKIGLMNQTQFKDQMNLIQGLSNQVGDNTRMSDWYSNLIKRLTIAHLKKKTTQRCLKIILTILLVIIIMCIIIICCKVYKAQKLDIILCSLLQLIIATITIYCFYRCRYKQKCKQYKFLKKYRKIYKIKNSENDNNNVIMTVQYFQILKLE